MQDEGESLKRMVNEYCEYFYKISTKSIFKPGTFMEFQAIEFDLGVMLKIFMQLKEIDFVLIDSSDIVIRYLRVTSLKKAFKELQLTLADYLSKDQEKKFIEASKNNVPFFKGTKRFYGPTMDEIYLIKEKREEFWTIKAVRKDLDNFLKDSFDAT